MKYPDDELMQKIHDLRRSFITKYTIVPTTVYLGHDEYYLLKAYGRVTLGMDLSECKVFGMNVKRVIEDNHISLGLTIE